MSEEDIEILENIKEYFNLKIKDGYHKIVYNDYMWEEKTIDCINSIDNLISAYKKQEKVIDEMAKMINKSYFDGNNFCLWFEKEIYSKNNCLSDRVKCIKQYFINKVKENKEYGIYNK